MKRFFSGLTVLLAFSALQSVLQPAMADSFKAEASLMSQVGELSWERSISWTNLVVKDPSNSPATELDEFKVDVVEDREPGHRKVTKYITSWKFHNFTEDNKNATSLQLTITFYDKDGHAIDSYQEKSPRDFCTYSPPFQELIAAPFVSKFNHIEEINTAVLVVTYNATYEASC
jgi:hypothetical protein